MSLSRNALIIDDELDICMLLSNILRQQSFKTNYALNLHDAQEQLNENAPDIVLLDLNLPDGSGFGWGFYDNQAFARGPRGNAGFSPGGLVGFLSLGCSFGLGLSCHMLR